MTDPQSPAPGPEAAVVFGQDAATVKKTAATSRAEFTRAVDALERAQADARAELDRQRAALEADFARQRATLEAQLGPLRQQLQRLQEVMWTVDLYLGRDETLRLIRSGTPAPAATPITIRQKVLVMAEESLLLMDRTATGMTADDVPEFVAWMLEHPAHLDRILPEPRGVVVLIPTRVQTRSGNLWEDAARDAANQSSWWLLRNGERLYLLTVDPELRVTERVLPRRREFEEVFDRRLFGYGRLRGEPVTPGSDEWLEMERVADARRRHYMRIMLVLQGIIDRTPVWQPLPEWGVNLLNLADQDQGKIVLLQDDEESIQLGDGRHSFREWQLRLNRQLRPGLRVIGNWHSRPFRDLYDRQYDRNGHPRLSPPHVDSVPAADVPHLIEERRDAGLVIRYARTDKVWRRDVPVPDRPGYVYGGRMPVTPSRRASCIVEPEDSWILPFDLVTVADLHYYLDSRDNRSDHFLSMVPTVKAALAAKHAEAAAERPFRNLIGSLLVDDGADPDTLAALTDDLVHWWKLANTWSRPLNGEPAHEARAVRDILAEHQARRAAAADDDAADMVRAGRQVPGAICVARNRRGQWHAYAAAGPVPPGERVYLDITPLRRDGSRGQTAAWQTVTSHSASLLHPAWATEEWRGWQFAANRRHYLSGPERDALIADVVDRTAGLPICVTEVHDPRQPGLRALVSYAWCGEDTPEETPAAPIDSPLGRQYGGQLVATRAWGIRKDAQGARLDGDAHGAVDYPTSFDHFSAAAGTRWGGIPWWPDDAHRYGDARPRLVWSDPVMLDRLASYVARCAAAASSEHQRRAERERTIGRYVTLIQAQIRAEQEAVARSRFLEDFGAASMDLWPAHLASLGLTAPVDPRTLRGLVAAAVEHQRPVVGQTLDALAQHTAALGVDAPRQRPSGARRIDLAGFGHVRVPDPSSADRGDGDGDGDGC